LESRIYDLVARHFVATASPDALYNRTRVVFQSCVSSREIEKEKKKEEEKEGEKFMLSAKVLVDPGFLEIQRFRSQRGGVDEEKRMPTFQKNEMIDIIGVSF
jgi:DNA topoisomerase IA